MSRTPFAALPDGGPTTCEEHGELLPCATYLRISGECVTVQADAGCSFYFCQGCWGEAIEKHRTGNGEPNVDVSALIGKEETLDAGLPVRVLKALSDEHFAETAENTHPVEDCPGHMSINDLSVE